MVAVAVTVAVRGRGDGSDQLLDGDDAEEHEEAQLDAAEGRHLPALGLRAKVLRLEAPHLVPGTRSERRSRSRGILVPLCYI